ncbi:MAG: ubiquinone/menaquinone biosynthesis methyltransferase [Candidatus Aminicenantes bacterium]|nr:ubiquinone/menaquinone biosynthesis methyltransferase [Candidatus Aminicenantes bacterium]
MKKDLERLFSEVSDNYELVNHVLTFGLDIYWRRKAAREAAKAGGSLWLDVCSGTGEMAQYLSRQADKQVRIVSADFCLPMMSKALEKFSATQILFSLSKANALPFPDHTFDLVTISFATRNINPRRDILLDTLREFWRVLRTGGRFVNLETSQPSAKLFRKLLHLYARLVVKPVGSFLSGSPAGYAYLSSTIPRFYPPEEFSLILKQAGFGSVFFRPLLFGVSAIHTAIKETES